jgi:hypothetical protein
MRLVVLFVLALALIGPSCALLTESEKVALRAFRSAFPGLSTITPFWTDENIDACCNNTSTLGGVVCANFGSDGYHIDKLYVPHLPWVS